MEERKQPSSLIEEDEGEIGELGEEINDPNDVPIEKPKCLSSINNNMSDK
jgi:hypothetical protein